MCGGTAALSESDERIEDIWADEDRCWDEYSIVVKYANQMIEAAHDKWVRARDRRIVAVSGERPNAS